MAEKIRINLSNGQKKSSDDQFLKAPRNWQKCSALIIFGRNENLVQNQLFALTKHQYLQNKLSKSQPPQQQQCKKENVK
jgi:hypothetical protein